MSVIAKELAACSVFFLGLLKRENIKLYQESSKTRYLLFVLMKLHLGWMLFEKAGLILHFVHNVCYQTVSEEIFLQNEV